MVPNEALFNGLQVLLKVCSKIFILMGTASRQTFAHYILMDYGGTETRKKRNLALF